VPGHQQQGGFAAGAFGGSQSPPRLEGLSTGAAAPSSGPQGLELLMARQQLSSPVSEQPASDSPTAGQHDEDYCPGNGSAPSSPSGIEYMREKARQQGGGKHTSSSRRAAAVSSSHSCLEKQRRDRLDTLLEELGGWAGPCQSGLDVRHKQPGCHCTAAWRTVQWLPDSPAGCLHLVQRGTEAPCWSPLLPAAGELVPAQDPKYTDSNAVLKRPKHAILSNTISKIQAMAQQLAEREAQLKGLRQRQAQAKLQQLQRASGSTAPKAPLPLLAAATTSAPLPAPAPQLAGPAQGGSAAASPQTALGSSALQRLLQRSSKAARACWGRGRWGRRS
jgi:hypothetical protein